MKFSFFGYKEPLLLICFLILIVLLSIIFLLQKRYLREKERYMTAEKQIKLMEDYYKTMETKQEETRSLWHDMKKYLLAIEALVAENQTESAKQEIQKLRTSYENVAHTVSTGNPIVDGILNYEMYLAKQHGVVIDMSLWLAKKLAIPATDLYIILGNTLDNAIEACADLPDASKRVVSISLKQKNHILFYEIENHFQEDMKKSKSKKIHGYGLNNVKKCIKTNQGNLRIKKSENIFSLKIFLNV